LAQDYHPLEVLIFDNHSTDGTLDIVRDEIARYRGTHTVRLHSSVCTETSEGPLWRTRTAGIEAHTGAIWHLRPGNDYFEYL
jgi:glycosyltransferase involved in cell wall biosynthesis